MLFSDRREAGKRLAAALLHLRDEPVVVLGLPRGGVPVAAEVARALGAPLDVLVVRKLGVPYQPELGMGAIGEGGVRVVDDDVVAQAGVSARDLAAVEAAEREELDRRVRRFRRGRTPVPLEGRTAVIVDDGIATGSTARAACRVARAAGARRVVLAVPVAPDGWEARLGDDADELVCVATPSPFFAIGQFYADFSQVGEDEVVACLGAGAGVDEELDVTAGEGVSVRGRLTVPPGAAGTILFAHGSGSSRNSPRNRFVAGELNRAGLGTLLFDLLTEEEERDRANVFDIDLLARRLVDATRWLRARDEVAGLRVGYFGASTGAAAALRAAAHLGRDIAAVVSRGGRPDLAGDSLAAVRAPTLLIVGGLDVEVLALNRSALARLGCEGSLVVVPGASHLFEEPGTLETVAGLARDWFVSHLVGHGRPGDEIG